MKMLTDPIEIEIISKARQKNVADPTRSRKHFTRIFEDFLREKELRGRRLLDLGPGQYDFGVLAAERDAVTHGIDNDPAVIELGEYKGFQVRRMRLQDLDPTDYDEPFDGIFCKYSINAFWFHDDLARLQKHITYVAQLQKPDGWSWIAPWNGIPKSAELSKARITSVIEAQAEIFRAHDFLAFDLTDKVARYYGVHGSTANRALFIRGLGVPNRLDRCVRM